MKIYLHPTSDEKLLGTGVEKRGLGEKVPTTIQSQKRI